MDNDHDNPDQIEAIDDDIEAIDIEAIDDETDDETDDAHEQTAEEFAALHPVFTKVLDPKLTKVNDKVLALVSAIVADLQLDLYDFEYSGGIVKITIDTPPGTVSETGRGGVTLDQLALATRLIGRDLDHHDPISGHYTLEVSSPGLERNLRTAVHFRREIGKTVTIRLRANVDGVRRVQGVLIAADDTTATVRLDDAALTERIVAIDMIDRAKTLFQWEKGTKGAPSKGQGPKAQGKSRSKNSPKKPKVAAGGIKPPPGPSDELDPPSEEEATR